jgi:hypothetical protein
VAAKGKAKAAPAPAPPPPIAAAKAKAKAKANASRGLLSQLVRSTNLLHQMSIWRVFLDGVETLVRKHLKVRLVHPDNEWGTPEVAQRRQHNANRNRTILEDVRM